MNTLFLFGMGSEPGNWEKILAFLIVGLIGFALCYIHRYLVFAVMPIFVWLAYYMVSGMPNSLNSQTTRTLSYFMFLIDFLAVSTGAFLSWKKYKAEQTNLK